MSNTYSALTRTVKLHLCCAHVPAILTADVGKVRAILRQVKGASVVDCNPLRGEEKYFKSTGRRTLAECTVRPCQQSHGRLSEISPSLITVLSIPSCPLAPLSNYITYSRIPCAGRASFCSSLLNKMLQTAL